MPEQGMPAYSRQKFGSDVEYIRAEELEVVILSLTIYKLDIQRKYHVYTKNTIACFAEF